MKNLFIFFITLTTLHSTASAQIKAGTLLFGVEINHGTLKHSEDAEYNAYRKKVNSSAEALKFQLEFNGKEGVFSLVDQLATDNDDLNARSAIYLLRGESVFYTDLSENIFIEQKDYYGEKLRFKKDISELKWEYTTETKKIGIYNCYKAIGVKYGSDKDYKVTETPIIVWYCPELPYQFGPFEAVGLPGLVLEYSLAAFTCKVEDLQLSKTEIKLKVPSSGKLTSQKEVDEIIKNRN